MILKANLTESEKKRCLQLYDAMWGYDPGSLHFYDISNQLIEMIHASESKVDAGSLEKEEERLRNLVLDNATLKQRILLLEASDDVKASLFTKYLKLEKLDVTDSSYATIKDQIEWVLKLPFGRLTSVTKLSHFSGSEGDRQMIRDLLRSVRVSLDDKLFGLDKVKEKLLMLLNDSITCPATRKSVALCGPPGVGKTAIAKAFAEAVGLPFDSISLGGARDSTLFYGSDNVYIGAGPGMIVRILCKMKYANGVILFDEVDKLSDTAEGREMQYALLHISDYVQNSTFRDKYLPDIKIDISKIWFFYSLNEDTHLDGALKNRLSILKIPPYTFSEKVIIATDYVLSEALTNVGMKAEDVTMSPEAAHLIITSTEREGGVRPIKNLIQDLVSHLNLYRTTGEGQIGGVKKNVIKITFPVCVTSSLLSSLVDLEIDHRLTYFA
jgi:ATP-dependent Lon protease